MIQARNRRHAAILTPTTVHIRRSYTECRYGQLHMAAAYPAGGGFDERTPLICIHPSGSALQFFNAIMPELGNDRSLYAIDLPGHGQSDPGKAANIAELASVVGEVIDGLRLRTVDVLGCQAGALIATELALAKPQLVRRLVLSSVPCYSPAERQAHKAQLTPLMAAADGSHLLKQWQHLRTAQGAHETPETLTCALANTLHAHTHGVAVMNAVLDYQTADRVALLRQPGLLLRVQDEYWEHTARAKTAYVLARMEEFPTSGTALFETTDTHLVQAVRQFLDG